MENYARAQKLYQCTICHATYERAYLFRIGEAKCPKCNSALRAHKKKPTDRRDAPKPTER